MATVRHSEIRVTGPDGRTHTGEGTMGLAVFRCAEPLPWWRRVGVGLIDAGAPHARRFVELVAFGWDVALLWRPRP
jgi:hypothetical protein